jgi:1-acyl-sn-glycerol-3-phosphate acyltransferase
VSPAFYRFCQFLLYVFFKLWNRLAVVGSENLPDDRQGFVLAANHTSFLDPPVLGAGFRRPIAFLAKEELFRVPVLGRVITLLGAQPVAAENDFRVIRSIIRRLRKGDVVSIFPEGTRSRDGELRTDAKSGVAFLAHTAGVPVVPCYIGGTRRALPRGKRFVRPRKITVYVDKPYHVPENLSDRADHYEHHTLYVMERIRSLREAAEGAAEKEREEETS